MRGEAEAAQQAGRNSGIEPAAYSSRATKALPSRRLESGGNALLAGLSGIGRSFNNQIYQDLKLIYRARS
jgi:hypothetical protein